MNESMEMYLETIFILENNHGHAHSAEIAKKLGVTKPSVSKAMKSLKERGLIDKEPYGTVTLTDKGRNYADQMYTNHKLIANYLEHSLGLESDEAGKNACRMEHILTDQMIIAIKKYMEDIR